MSEIKSTWLTQEAFDRLTAEFEERQGVIRSEITKKIETAREEGDLKENGGYHAAREEQGKNEARIRQLKQIIENATIGTPPSDTSEIAVGHVVSVKFADGDVETFWLASREEAQHATMDVYSPESPLGQAVLGKKAGDKSGFELPNGKQIEIEIVEVKTYSA
jgi:transcription elongation factor GreA